MRHDRDAAERLLRRFEAIRRTNDLLTEQPNGALLIDDFQERVGGDCP